MRPMIDAHLDLAWSALYFNRNLLGSVQEVRAAERHMTDELSRGRNTVTFPELQRVNVAVCVATLMGRSGVGQPYGTSLKRIDLDYATRRGYRATDIDGIFYGNWLRFFFGSIALEHGLKSLKVRRATLVIA